MMLRALNGGQVKDNVITNFGFTPSMTAGIYLTNETAIGDIVGGNLVEGNSVSSLPGGSFNHLEGNSAQGNRLSCGIYIVNGNSHSYRNNIGGGNGAIGAGCISAGNLDQGGNAGL